MYHAICPVLGCSERERFMTKTGILQNLRRMKFSDYYERTKSRQLTQTDAADLLGMSERSFRRYSTRYEADVPEPEIRAALDVVKDDGGDALMGTLAEKWMEQGEARGEAKALSRLLTLRFGPPPRMLRSGSQRHRWRRSSAGRTGCLRRQRWRLSSRTAEAG